MPSQKQEQVTEFLIYGTKELKFGIQLMRN